MFDRLDDYNVAWDSPSTGPSGSMPLGNGDIGLNVWMEPTGDLLLLIAKSDAWDENSINLKLGGIRIRFTPNPLCSGESFSQALRLRSGEIEIRTGSICLRIWVDANQPVIHVDADGDSPFEMQAALEIWRTEPRTIKTQTSDLFKNLVGKNSDPYPTIVWPDRILPARNNRIIWCHHNEKRDPDGYEINMKLQGLGEFLDRMPHPLTGRTFGGAMGGDGLIAINDQTLRSSAPQSGHRLNIYALTAHPASVDEWQTKLETTIAQLDRTDARRNHLLWWEKFWNRSWIYIRSDSPQDSAAAFHITQGYILQRFMNAAAGRCSSPIKFNGSLFTVGQGDDPDFRRWGGPGFWFQNTRLIYWPMLAAGDFDLMRPWLEMYRAMLPLQQHRTERYFHHAGAHYPETIMFWGAEVSGHYGWTPFEQRARPEAECEYLTYYWSGGLELVVIMQEYFAYTGDQEFARATLLPIADAVIEFFDLHYPRDENGKIRFEPAQSLETWHWAINPTPEIAGLSYTLGKMLSLPHELTTSSQRDRWTRLLSELPRIPIGEKDGKRVILPADKFDKKKNTENPELHSVFPYRIFGASKPDLQLARDTFAARLHPSHDCWSQDEIQMALLGLAEEARQSLTLRASPASHSDSRFPGFWNAFHDWIPDMDHGGVLQMALQLMLVQTEGDRIEWLPAWPAHWNADFKLHLPGAKISEGSVRAGRLENLKIKSEEV
jgi:hypothetical protein